MVMLDSAWSNLGATISPSDGSLYVHREFPGTERIGMEGAAELVIGREVVAVTGGSGLVGDPWTINRAQRGTDPTRHLRRAKVSLLPHHIRVTSIHGGVWDYTARWGYPFNWHMTTACPGGHESCSWSVIDWGYPLTAVPDGRSKVVVYDGLGNPYWLGQIDENDPEFRIDGATVNLVARGYALRGTDEGYTRSKSFDAFTPVYLIMDEVRADKMPDVQAGSYPGGGRSIVVRSQDFLGRKPMEIFNEIAAYGDLDDQPVYWFIRNHGDETPYLDILNRLECSLTSYEVPIEWLRPPRLNWRTSSVINQAIVQHSRGSVSSDNAEGQAALNNIIRSRYIDGGPRLDGIGTARQIGRSLVAAMGTMLPSGSLTVEYPHFVYDNHGNEIPLWLIEAGHPLTITGPADTGNTRVPITSMFITGTDMDMDGRTQGLATENARKLVDDISHYLRGIERSPQNGGNFAGQPQVAPTPSHTASAPAPTGSSKFGAPGLYNAANNVVGTDGRVGYPVLPEGADIAIPIFNLGNGNDPLSLLVGTHGDVQTFWPMRILAATLKSDVDATVEVQVKMQTFSGGVLDLEETNLFTIATTGGQLSDIIVQDAGITEPFNQLVFPAGVWLRAECIATDGVSPHVVLTLYGQKLSGKADPDDPVALGAVIGTPPIADSVEVSAGAGIATFTATTTDMTVLVIEYGQDTNYGNAWPWDLEYTTNHEVTLDGFEGGETYFYQVTAYDWQGAGRVVGSGSFMGG